MGTARARRTVLLHAVLVACAAIVIVPAMWIALAAFKTQIALLRGDVLFKPYLGNFDELLFSRSADYGAHFANSVIVATSATALVLVVATLAAYSMHRMRWPRFLLFNAAGGILWAALYGVGGYLLGDNVHRLTGPVGVVALIFAAAAIVVSVIFLRRNERRLADEADRVIPDDPLARSPRTPRPPQPRTSATA